MGGKVRLPTEAEIALWDKTINGGVVLEELLAICDAARLARQLVLWARSRLKALACECDDEGGFCEMHELSKLLAQVADEVPEVGQ